MHRRRFLLTAALALGLAPTVARAQDAIEGTLESVDTARGTLTVRHGDRSRTGRFSAETRITIDGMPGEIRDLRPGQRVTVRFAVTRGGSARDVIVAVEARTR